MSNESLNDAAIEKELALKKAIEKKIVNLKGICESKCSRYDGYRQVREACIQYVNGNMCENCLMYEVYILDAEVILTDIRDLFPSRAQQFLDCCVTPQAVDVSLLKCESS